MNWIKRVAKWSVWAEIYTVSRLHVTIDKAVHYTNNLNLFVWKKWLKKSLNFYYSFNGDKMFNWQSWIQRFINSPGYNDTGAAISEAIRPSYEVIGVHRLTPPEDYTQQYVYVDVLSKDNERQIDAKVEYNSKVREPVSVSVDAPFGKIVSFLFPDDEDVNIWHPDGEGVFGLVSGYSYLIVFREVDKIELAINPGGIQVTVNQEWIANMRPDRQGNVTFFVDIKQ